MKVNNINIGRRLCFLVLSSAIVLMSTSCFRPNKLKTDEISLSEKIIQEERKKDSLLEEQKSLIDTTGPSIGIKFIEEERKEDPNNPLQRLDIIKSRGNLREVGISEISRELDYLHLSISGDTNFVGKGCIPVFSQNFIYVKGDLGIACFDRDGNFLKRICKSTTDHYTTTKNGSMVYVSQESIKLFYGSMGDINTIGDKLVYLYKDYPNQINQLMMFDPAMDFDVVPGLNTEEVKTKGDPVGSILRSFNMDYRGTNLYPLDEESFGFIPSKLGKDTKASILVSKTYAGDTSCLFTDYDPVNNFSNTVSRGVESGDQYYLNGQFHIRPKLNDTVFRLELPNRLIPKFLIDFGGRGIPNSLEGLDPRFSLTDKFVHSDIIETAGNIFVQYTQDYSCPNTAKKGTLKFNRAVYFKKSSQLIHIMKDAVPILGEGMSWPTPKMVGLKNDIDIGLDFWPDGISESGVPYMVRSGKSLNKEIWELGCKSKELNDLAKRIKSNELVIILAK